MDYTKEQIEKIVDDCTAIDDECYREWLDGIDGDINVCGMIFQASRIIEELDPTAYRCGYSDYLNCIEAVEVDGEYYYQDDIDKAIQELEEDD